MRQIRMPFVCGMKIARLRCPPPGALGDLQVSNFRKKIHRFEGSLRIKIRANYGGVPASRLRKPKNHIFNLLVQRSSVSLATINSPTLRPSALSDIGHPPTTSSLAGQHPPSVPTQGRGRFRTGNRWSLHRQEGASEVSSFWFFARRPTAVPRALISWFPPPVSSHNRLRRQYRIKTCRLLEYRGSWTREAASGTSLSMQRGAVVSLRGGDRGMFWWLALSSARSSPPLPLPPPETACCRPRPRRRSPWQM